MTTASTIILIPRAQLANQAEHDVHTLLYGTCCPRLLLSSNSSISDLDMERTFSDTTLENKK